MADYALSVFDGVRVYPVADPLIKKSEEMLWGTTLTASAGTLTNLANATNSKFDGLVATWAPAATGGTQYLTHTVIGDSGEANLNFVSRIDLVVRFYVSAALTNDSFTLQVYDGTAWTTLATFNTGNQPPTTLTEFIYNVTATLNTIAKVNAAQFRFAYTRAGAVDTSILIDEVKISLKRLWVEVETNVAVDENVAVLLFSFTSLDVFDSVAVEENVQIRVTPLRVNVFDSVAALENVDISLSAIFASVFDLVSIAENVSTRLDVLNVSVADDVAVAENASVFLTNWNIDVFDLAVVEEHINTRVNWLNIKEVFEEVAVAEDVNLSVPELPISVNDSVALAEAVSLFLDRLNFSVEEPFDILVTEHRDVLDLIVEVGVVAEELYADDFAFIVLESLNVFVEDNVSVEEMTLEFIRIFFAKSDDVLVEENVSFNMPVAFDVNDSVAIAEAVLLLPAFLNLSVNDSVVVEDEGYLTSRASIIVNEGIGVVEYFNVSLSELFINLYESISIIDNFYNEAFSEIIADDSVAVTDVLFGLVVDPLNRSVYEEVWMWEDVSPFFDILFANVVEPFGILITEVGQIIDLIVEVGVTPEGTFVTEDLEIYLDCLPVDVFEIVGVNEEVSFVNGILEVLVWEDVAVVEWSNLLDIFVDLGVSEDITITEYIELWFGSLSIFVVDSVMTGDEFISSGGGVEVGDDVGVSGGALADWLSVSEEVVLSKYNLYEGIEVAEDIGVVDGVEPSINALFTNVYEPVGVLEWASILDIVIEVPELWESLSVVDVLVIGLILEVNVFEPVIFVAEHDALGFNLAFGLVFEAVNVSDVLRIVLLIWDAYPRIFDVSPRERIFEIDKVNTRRGEVMRTPVVMKQPEEVFAVGLQYVSPDLEEGAYIASCSVKIKPVETSGGLVAEGDVVVEPTMVSQMISGGTSGHNYYVEFMVVTSGGHTYEDEIYVKVRER